MSLTDDRNRSAKSAAAEDTARGDSPGCASVAAGKGAADGTSEIEQGAQDRLWEHYQNETTGCFDQSVARLQFLVKRLRPGERVLDVGVGDGTLEQLAVNRGIDIHCLDPSERSIRNLQDRFGLGDRARVGYGRAIPFDSGYFDAVVISEVLEHLDDENLLATLAEIARVLRPGGRIVGTVPAREDLAAEQVLCPCCGTRFHRWGHQQSFTPQRMRELLESHFRVLRLGERTFESLTHLNWKGRLLAIVHRLLNLCGVHGSGERLWFEAAVEARGTNPPVR